MAELSLQTVVEVIAKRIGLRDASWRESQIVYAFINVRLWYSESIVPNYLAVIGLGFAASLYGSEEATISRFWKPDAAVGLLGAPATSWPMLMFRD